MHKALLLIAVLLLPACDDGQEAKPRPTTTTDVGTTAPSAVTTTTENRLAYIPDAFVAHDSSWVDTEHGWVLGAGPCSDPPCTSILETRDGGRSWARLAAPKAFIGAPSFADCDSHPCVNSIRFANERVGWVFGPRFFVTSDGGQHWAEERSPPVEAVEAAGGQVFRVVGQKPSSSGCVPACPYRIERAPLESSSWQQLATPDLGGMRPQLLLEGSRVYAAAFRKDAHPSLVRSVNGGRTWQKLEDPCGDDAAGENDGYFFAAAKGRFLAVLCSQRVGDSRFLLVSTDAGATWSGKRTVDPGSSVLSAAAPGVLSLLSTVFTAPGRRTEAIATSHDGGRSWKTVLTVEASQGAGGNRFLGYQDERTGRAALAATNLWTTHDAGLSWTEAKFPP